MKPGDLVKYKPAPHRGLRHLVGIVTSFSRAERYCTDLDMVWVVWGHDRPQGSAGSPLEEFIDELEVINESR